MEFKDIKDEVAYTYGLYFENNEEILVLKKPNINSFLLNEITNKILEFFFMVVIILIFHLIANLNETEYRWQETIFYFVIFGLITFGKSIHDFLKLRKTVYILTNQKIVIQSNFYNSSTNIIHTQFIETKDLKKSFIDKKYSTGNILIHTGETRINDGTTEKVYEKLISVFEPEEFFNKIEIKQ